MQKYPFYGTMLLRIPMYPDETIETACTNGRVIRYNPAFMGRLDPRERRFVLMHELMHVLLLHPFRQDARNPRMYNVAADLVVNRICMQAFPRLGLKTPENGLFDHACRYIGLTTEEVYAVLREANKDVLKGEKSMVLVPPDRFNAPKGGLFAPDGALDLQPGSLTAEEKKALEQEIRRLASEASKGTGNERSALAIRELNQLFEGRILPWKNLLRDYMLELEEDDETSYATPERKYLHMDLILPGHPMSEGKLPEVWAFVDSSGSIGNDEMQAFLTQLFFILHQFQCTMHIAYWDTSVTDVYRNITTEKKLKSALPRHSGGTNINCVYDYLRTARVRPDLMIILTDGYFGMLSAENRSRRLREKTILVLSPNHPDLRGLQEIGKIAKL